ncbi:MULTISPECIES: CopM family metallochaperone [Pseudomonadota]|jgi:uncharacterized protein (DUF305 family)|uniref:Uncharacterized protein conserved in bacteria n=2 Tax=Pseudomonadota TaxID=1224 RepID=A0AAJ4ZHW4_9RALS|nr:DUF305 domain-containing protein [Stenotrophomonas maltophilia]MBN0324688.1 DUF305 domain-containing protein [Pseudomonas aeruginosa]MDI3260504.1 DUF305 domain-containing protein [Nevskiaceae bacterium]CAG2153573.1 hypothetical protein LMG6866_04472 [Ralstonia mannitolilytica]QGL81636.1 DUF305 domain-containing protein [Stenotrophomonas maltophilia]QNG77636.1 hypothetical protein GPNADHDJ_01837 [Stenotrophomonas maltophilia]
MQTPAFTITLLSRSTRPLVFAALAMLVASPALAQHAHSHPAATLMQSPPAFVASTAKPFAQLMDDAMAVMEHDMRAAPMNGNPDHDFVTMMIPHHQGAIDMAKAVLLHTQDPELRNLALSIITEQHNEIRLMQAWLARHADGAATQDAAGNPSHSTSTTQGTR